MAKLADEGRGSITDVVLVPVAEIKPHPAQDLIPPQKPEEYASMKADIAERGIQEPLTITDKGFLLDGHHRWRAAKELGLADVEVKIMSGLSRDQQIVHMVTANVRRRHLTPSQRAAILTHPKLKPHLDAVRQEARERQVGGGRAGGKKAGRGRSKDRVQEIVPEAYDQQPAQTRDVLGRVAGVSGKLVDAALFVWAQAPDRMEPILRGDPKPTLSALARELRAKPADPEVPDARFFASTDIEHAGEYDTALTAIIQLSAKSVGLIWTISSGPGEGFSVVQKVPDIWDEMGMVRRHSRLGQFLCDLIDWPENDEPIEGSSLLGLTRRFEVSFVDCKRRIRVLPDQDGTSGEDTPPQEPPLKPEGESLARYRNIWDNAEEKSPDADETGADERRCLDCGDPIGDAPCDLCIDCESQVKGENVENGGNEND